MTLHQGGIEAIFRDSMKSLGVEVEQSTFPTAIELSTDEVELADPTSHPVKVGYFYSHLGIYSQGNFR